MAHENAALFDNCQVNEVEAIPALTRAPTRDADSSDEEQERLLELGNAGR